MLKVLIPTDFSTHSYNALSYAQDLFKNQPVAFTLLHAYEASAFQLLGNKSPSRLAAIYKALNETSIQKLQDLKTKILLHNNNALHFYNIQAREGHLKDIIDDFNGKDFQYVFMGSKGATGLQEIFLGSVTYSIVSLHQEIPILIIPEKASFFKFERVGFETDFKSDYSKQELLPLLNLLKIWDATVHTFQVYEKPELSKTQERHLEHLWILLKNVKSSFHVVPKFSSLEECIRAFEQELDIDLLVMIDYPLTLIDKLMSEPIIKKLTFHSKLPLLIIPSSS